MLDESCLVNSYGNKTKVMLRTKPISTQEILNLLDNIEKYPLMYGKDLQVVENIYFLLLSILSDDPRSVDNVSSRVLIEQSQGKNCLTHEIEYEVPHFMNRLKEVRKRTLGC